MRVVEISGGVGGARLARGLSRIEGIDLTIVVNIADDEDIHGLHVSPDLDTVVYTLAGLEGPHGWGRRDDSFVTNEHLGRLGADNTFQLGDKDLAMNIMRTAALRSGVPLSKFTGDIAGRLGLEAAVIPASDDPQRTMIETSGGEILGFQEYFVLRQHRDEVRAIEFRGHPGAAPGVLEAIESADLVVVAPSNPPLSIWPILEVAGIRPALQAHHRVIGVSPLFAGRALKGPADRVMRSLGLAPGNAGVVEAYRGLLGTLVIDSSDAGDVDDLDGREVSVVPLDTRIIEPSAAERLAREILRL